MRGIRLMKREEPEALERAVRGGGLEIVETADCRHILLHGG